MPRLAGRSWPAALALALVGTAMSGCAGNGLVMQGQVERLQQQQVALTGQNQQLQERTNALARDNEELDVLLAQARQQSAVQDDQLAALREQLRGVTEQLAQARQDKDASQKKVETLTASLTRQGSVSISPNNSLLQTLPSLNLPQGNVRRDGDVIRVALPAAQLFEPGGARLRPEGINLILAAATELLRLYPQQMIGVEGYTDTDPVYGGPYRSNHELSVGWAITVYDVLVTRTRLQPAQLFVVGHGPNHPMVSNATPAGKQANRRVELVVYPEKPA